MGQRFNTRTGKSPLHDIVRFYLKPGESNSVYYAQMFCYGSDPNHVGITGIRGCLGAVFAAAHHLYAVHIPPMNTQRDAQGARAFTAMVTGAEGANPAGTLYVFVNGTNRLQAHDEARSMKEDLGGVPCQVYRIMANLGAQSGTASADSVVIKVERMVGGFDLSYKRDDDLTWVAGGLQKTGCYYPEMEGSFGSAKVPDAPGFAGGWFQMTRATCSILNVR